MTQRNVGGGIAAGLSGSILAWVINCWEVGQRVLVVPLSGPLFVVSFLSPPFLSLDCMCGLPFGDPYSHLSDPN